MKKEFRMSSYSNFGNRRARAGTRCSVFLDYARVKTSRYITAAPARELAMRNNGPLFTRRRRSRHGSFCNIIIII